MNREKGGGNFWMGFFFGGLLGALLIMLFGTKEGKKIAAKLVQKSEFFEDELEEKIYALQEKGEALVTQAQEVKDRVTQEIEDGKKTVSQHLATKMDETLTKIEDIQKKGVSLTQDVHHHYFKKNGKKLVS